MSLFDGPSGESSLRADRLLTVRSRGDAAMIRTLKLVGAVVKGRKTRHTRVGWQAPGECGLRRDHSVPDEVHAMKGRVYLRTDGVERALPWRRRSRTRTPPRAAKLASVLTAAARRLQVELCRPAGKEYVY